MCDEQHGFRFGRSTTTINLIEFDAAISNILNSGHFYEVILIDFKKAFDKVPHTKLISRLCHMRQGKSVVKWISNFLQNKSQTVYKGACLEPCKVTS